MIGRIWAYTQAVACAPEPEAQLDAAGKTLVERDVSVRTAKTETLSIHADTPPLAVAPFDVAKAKEYQDTWAKHLGPTSTTSPCCQRPASDPEGIGVLFAV